MLRHVALCFLPCYAHLLYLHSFPTRRSSDLVAPRSPRPGRRPRSGSRAQRGGSRPGARGSRSEEDRSELQSPDQLVCRLLLERKKVVLRKRAHGEPVDDWVCLLLVTWDDDAV